MFWSAAGLAGILSVPALFVRSSPKDIGAEEPQADTNRTAQSRMPNQPSHHAGTRHGLQEGHSAHSGAPDNSPAGDGSSDAVAQPGGALAGLSTWERILCLLREPRFLLVIVMAACIELIRESFVSWLPVFYKQHLELDAGTAGILTMVFPLCGAVSTIGGGWLMDRATPQRRGLVPLVMLNLQTAALAGLALLTVKVKGDAPKDVAVLTILIGAVALSGIGTWGFVKGVFPLDLGGKAASGLSTGMVDAAAYGVGAVASSFLTGYLSERKGWPVVWLLLTCVSAADAVAAAVYWWLDLRIVGRSSGGSGGNDAADSQV